jgi:hypothetical protein
MIRPRVEIPVVSQNLREGKRAVGGALRRMFGGSGSRPAVENQALPAERIHARPVSR